MERNNSNKIIPVVVLAIMTLGSIGLEYFRPIFSDDLAYWNFLGLDDYVMPNRRTISFILAHIFGVNGRLFEYMGPIMVDLMPRWLQALFMGSMAGLYFYGMLLSTKRKGLFSVVFLAVTLAVMPWWDGMLIHACQFNYPWGTTFCLLFFWFFFHGSKNYNNWAITGLFILSIFAGATHEQTGVAMCAGMLGYAFYHRNYTHFDKPRRWMIYGLLFGTLLPVGAPAIWQRALQVSTTSFHYPLGQLILITFPVYILLLLILLILNRRWRPTVEDVVMLAAATIAAVIGAASGTPGRTGWFSESISLILLARIWLRSDLHPANLLKWVIAIAAFVFICVHYAVSVRYQARAYAEFEEMTSKFIKSDDGVVYLDYHPRYDVPGITLYRIYGIYPPYESWCVKMMSEAYGDSIKSPLVLPEAFEDREFRDSLTIGNVTLYRHEAPNVLVTQDSTLIQPWHGMMRIVRQGPGYEAAIAVELEPADMFQPVISKREK